MWDREAQSTVWRVEGSASGLCHCCMPSALARPEYVTPAEPLTFLTWLRP